MKIGIMTGGGDSPGLNAVIRGAVKVGVHRHGFEMLGIEDAFSGLIDLDYRSPHGNRWLDSSDVRDILSRGGTILGTSNRCDPFRFVVGTGADQRIVDVTDRLLANFAKLGLEGLICIGGDGSMRIAKELHDLGMPIVGVPKTIDNDLAATDVTFGFGTAVQFATEAIDRIRDTAESHDRVMLVEVMGREAGFIALTAGLAGGAHAILIPEIPYHVAPIAHRITERRERGGPYSIIVVAEGAKPHDGEMSVIEQIAGGMPRLAGAAHALAAELSATLAAEMRVTVLGHTQRGGSPSAFDRVLATRFGHAAADLVARRRFGRMVALRGQTIIDVPLSEAVDHPKRVDPAGQLVSTARALGVVFGDE